MNKLVTFFLVAIAALILRGAPTWTTGTWSTFTPATNNLLLNLQPTAYDLKTSAEGKRDVRVFTDGKVSSKNTDSTCLGNSATLAYTFQFPSRIDSVRFYTANWSGRNNVSIASIAYADEFGKMVQIEGSSLDYVVGSGGGYACLSDSEKVPLAAKATSLTINFAQQENGYVGYFEIEVLGQPGCYRRIAVSPEGVVEPTPGTGVSMFTPNEEVTLSTPDGSFVDDTGFFLVTFVGYDILFGDGTIQSGETASLTFTPTQAYTLTWKYNRERNPAVDVPERALLSAYAQGGLIACWDGIYNQGTNFEHSMTATAWKDLVGTHDLTAFTNPDGVTVALPVWGENCLTWTGSSTGQAVAYVAEEGLNLLTSNTNITLELVGNCNSYAGNNAGLFCLSPDDKKYRYGEVAMSGRFGAKDIYCTFGSSSQYPIAGYLNPLSEDGSLSVTFVTEGKDAKLYYQGNLVMTKTGGVTVKTAKSLVLGAACYGDSFGAGANFTLHGVRLYDRALSAGEVRHNHMIDSARYYGGKIGDTLILVAGDPGNYGTPKPMYGQVFASAGGTLRMSAVETLTTYEDGQRAVMLGNDERAVYLGYTVSTSGVTVAQCSAETGQWTILAAAPATTALNWQWRRESLVTAAQSGCEGCQVEIVGATSGGEKGGSTDAWVPNEGSVTLRAVACNGARFVGWSGDTSGIADLTAEETAITVRGPAEISAVFVEAHHEPVTVVLKSGASGSWFDAANWEGGVIPQEGDTVLLTPSDGSSPTLKLTASTPLLEKIVISNCVDNCRSTLECANWMTCINANEVVVGNGGFIVSSRGFYDTEMSNRVWIAAETLSVDVGGVILAENAGWAPGNGMCRKLAGSSCGSDGGAYGGLGGDVWSGDVASGVTTARTYGDAEWPTDPGCGRMSNSPASSLLSDSGGGAIRLDIAGPVLINGRVSSDCTSLGGSGGSVLIVCTSIDGNGTVSACAASGFSTEIGGGGGGGRIAIHYDPEVQSEKDASCRIALRARGGYVKEVSSSLLMRMGGPGTVWLSDPRFLSASAYADEWPFSGALVFGSSPEMLDLHDMDIVLNGDQIQLESVESFRCRSLKANGGWSRANGAVFSHMSVTVDGDVLLQGAAVRMIGGSLTVGGKMALMEGVEPYKGGELWLDASVTNAPGQFGVTCAVAGALTVATNAIIYPRCEPNNNAIPCLRVGEFYLAEGGFVDGIGKGASAKATALTYVGNSASHGGRGAENTDKSIYCYGDREHPVCPGSGGNSRGGSVFLLTASAGRIDGIIDCSAADSNDGPGSGGSVWLTIPSLQRSKGTIRVCGGNGYHAGGGGRIALYTQSAISSRLTLSASCGISRGVFIYPAQDGTIYIHRSPGFLIFLR